MAVDALPVALSGVVITEAAGFRGVACFPGDELSAGLVAEEPFPELFALPATPTPAWLAPLAPPGLATPLAVGVALGAVKIVSPLVGGGGLFGSSGGRSGTEGNRCARMSAARIGEPPSATDGSFSSCCVITSTSSRRLKSTAGLTRILRKSSGPGETLVTVPTGKPLGKI